MSSFHKLWRSVNAFTREFKRNSVELAKTAAALPSEPKQDWKRPKIGIALGGGFARGMAHIGILKVFEEEDIPIDFVGGTSVGAVIGAAFCSGVSAKELEEIGALVKFSDFARYTISRYGLCSNDRLSHLLSKILKVKTFEELRIPLLVTATEFLTGESVIFTKGALIERVRASCAYPGVFTPVTVDGKLMVDGLLAHSVPATPLKHMGAEKIVSVYFNAHWVRSGGPKHVLDIIGQCFSIAQANMSCLWRADTDVCLEPEVAEFGFDDFAKTSELVKVGEAAARAALPQIRCWLEAPQAIVEVAPRIATPANSVPAVPPAMA